MNLVLVIEQFAGQHSDLQPPAGSKIKYCKCAGPVERGSDSCLRCGKYIRELFRIRKIDHSRRAWEQLMRERPHDTTSRREAA